MRNSSSLYLLILVLGLSGCMTTGSINKEYAQVDYANGVNRNEAIAIAKRSLIASEYASDYHVKKVIVMHKRLVRVHPDFWFIAFEPKHDEIQFWTYLVVISKDTGSVIFSDPHVPLDQISYDWIFN